MLSDTGGITDHECPNQIGDGEVALRSAMRRSLGGAIVGPAGGTAGVSSTHPIAGECHVDMHTPRLRHGNDGSRAHDQQQGENQNPGFQGPSHPRSVRACRGLIKTKFRLDPEVRYRP